MQLAGLLCTTSTHLGIAYLVFSLLSPTLSQNLSDDMGGVPAPAHAAQVVADAAKVEEGVEVVYPGPGSGPLVRHRVRHPVLLPPQPRQRVVPAPPKPNKISHQKHQALTQHHPAAFQCISTYIIHTFNPRYENEIIRRRHVCWSLTSASAISCSPEGA
jgi:hypothetical protein